MGSLENQIQKRLSQLESRMSGCTSEKDAKAYVLLSIKLGLWGGEVDVDEMTEQCIEEGLTLSNVLKKIDGMTRGLPSERAGHFSGQ